MRALKFALGLLMPAAVAAVLTAAPVRQAAARAASMGRSAPAGHAARAAAGTAVGQPAAKAPTEGTAHDDVGYPRARASAPITTGPNDSRDAITP